MGIIPPWWGRHGWWWCGSGRPWGPEQETGYMAAAGRKAKNEQEVGLQSCHQRPTFSSEILALKGSKSFPKPQWLGNNRLYTRVCFSHANHNTFLFYFIFCCVWYFWYIYNIIFIPFWPTFQELGPRRRSWVSRHWCPRFTAVTVMPLVPDGEAANGRVAAGALVPDSKAECSNSDLSQVSCMRPDSK